MPDTQPQNAGLEPGCCSGRIRFQCCLPGKAWIPMSDIRSMRRWTVRLGHLHVVEILDGDGHRAINA